jgi:hypothetical protein
MDITVGFSASNRSRNNPQGLSNQAWQSKPGQLDASQAEVWLGSSFAKPAELGQGSARSAHSAREDYVAHKSTIPCELKLFCALQIYHEITTTGVPASSGVTT